jgi:hypothetical protein
VLHLQLHLGAALLDGHQTLVRCTGRDTMFFFP